MKATGIVRRIDDLGRVVIPKEIRRTMRIREGDPLEIYTEKDGEVIFKKYSPMGELANFASQICESMYKTTGEIIAICDRDSVIAVAGGARRELLEKRISQNLERIMENRSAYFSGGRADIPVKLMLIGGALKLVVNYIFVAMPQFNIKAASWGTLVCYIFIAVASVMVLVKQTKIKLNFIMVFLKPFVSGIVCGITALGVYFVLSKFFSNGISTLASIAVAAVFYVFSLILLKTLAKDDILMLPKGEKLVKILAKRNLLS